MSKSEMIKWLQNLKEDIGQTQHQDLWHYEEMLDKVISTIEVSEDAISRANLIKSFLADCECESREEAGAVTLKLEDMLELIEDAPSVVPSRAEGEWKFKKIFPNDDSEFPMGYLVCSVCGSQHTNATPCNYCDNCGAKMKG